MTRRAKCARLYGAVDRKLQALLDSAHRPVGHRESGGGGSGGGGIGVGGGGGGGGGGSGVSGVDFLPPIRSAVDAPSAVVAGIT